MCSSDLFRLDTSGGTQQNMCEGLSNTALCDVYSIDGCIVAHNVAGVSSLTLRAGIYIEVRDGKARKIVVK